jgi:hypothetical protein
VHARFAFAGATPRVELRSMLKALFDVEPFPAPLTRAAGAGEPGADLGHEALAAA